MRVVSWNVRSLRDGSAAVAAVLRGLQPDVVVLQEAPRLVLWRASRARLARAAGLRRATRGRADGNAVLTAPHVVVERTTEVRLPRRPGLHRRAVVVAVLVVEGRRLAVVGSHLDLEPAARLDSAARVRAAVPAGLPLLLAADVNEEPGGPAWAVLAEGLVDLREGCAPTFPVWAPARHLDGLWASPSVRAGSCQVVPTGAASDHLALLAEVELP